MSKNLETSQELRNCKLVWMDSFRFPDIGVYDFKTLDQVVYLLEEVLLAVLLDEVFLLFQSCGRFLAL